MGLGGGDAKLDRLVRVVAGVFGVAPAEIVATGKGHRWAVKANRARAVTAYLCAFDLQMSYRQIGEALGYCHDGAAHTTVHRLIREHGLPPVPPRPWRTGKRLQWAEKAPTRPDVEAKPTALALAPDPPPVKVIEARRRVPASPPAPVSPAPSLPIASPPVRQPGPHHSLGRMATPANPAPVSFGGLSERVLTFLANRNACTTQTLATCLDAKELTVGQVLSQLRHEGRVIAELAPDGSARGQLWRVTGAAE